MRLTACISFLFLIALISVPIVAGQDVRSKAFDPSGGYHPLTPPVGGDKFVQFSLRMRTTGARWLGVGEVRGVQPWYPFSTRAIGRSGLRFVTEARNRVRYEFRGKFLKTGNFADAWVGQGLITLRGKLIKYDRGKKIWEIETPFVYYPPH